MRLPIRRAMGPAVCACALACACAHADDFVQRPPHVHGHVTINVALEGRQLQIELDAPAINVVGFEHTPRTPAELAAVKEAAHRFNTGRDLLGTPADAACAFQTAQLTEPHWEDDSADEHDGHGEHADYRAQLTYRCGSPAKLTWMEPWLVDGLLRVTEARINVVSPAGQRSQSVGAGHVRVELP